MGDGAEAAASDPVDEHAVVLELGHEIRGGQAMVGDIEDHNVGLDMLRRDAYGRNLLQCSREFFGMVMIVLESGDMMLERIDAGGREDAGLAHSPAVHAAEAPRTFNQLGVAGGQQRAGRRPETLGEAEGYRFEMLRIGGRWQSGRA